MPPNFGVFTFINFETYSSVPMLMTSKTTNIQIKFIHSFISFESLVFFLLFLNQFKSHFHIILILESIEMHPRAHENLWSRSWKAQSAAIKIFESISTIFTYCSSNIRCLNMIQVCSVPNVQRAPCVSYTLVILALYAQFHLELLTRFFESNHFNTLFNSALLCSSPICSMARLLMYFIKIHRQTERARERPPLC